MKKSIFSILLLFITVVSFSQGVVEGTYLHNQGGKVKLSKLSGGGIHVVWSDILGSSEGRFDYNPNTKNIYETKTSGDGFSRLILDFTQKDFVKEIYLTDDYKIVSTSVWAKDRKRARAIAKQEKANKGKAYIQEIELANPQSEMHKNNVHKILFFNGKPEFGQEEAKLKTNFKLGEAIWAVVYLAKPLGGYGIDVDDKVRLELGYLDGTQYSSLASYNFKFDKEKLKTRNFIRFEVLPDLTSGKSDNSMGSYLSTFWQIQKLNPVEYTFVVKVMKFQGTFGLDCSNMDALNKIAAKTEQEEIDKVELPKSRSQDRELARECLLAIQRWGHAAKWKEKFSKAILTTTNWAIVRDDYNNIIGRIVEAACVAKWPDGRCSYQYFTFIQDYEGGGQYAGTVRRYSTGRQYTINCNKIN